MTVRRIYKRADFVQVKEKSRKNIGIFRGFLTMDCAKYAFYKRVRIPTVTLRQTLNKSAFLLVVAKYRWLGARAIQRIKNLNKFPIIKDE